MKHQYVIESGRKRLAKLVTCLNCGKVFLKAVQTIKRSSKHFCNQKCFHTFQGRLLQNKIEVLCYTCGTKILRTPARYNASVHKVFFCSKNCQNKGRLTSPEKGITNYFGQTGLGENPARRLATSFYGKPTCTHCHYSEHEGLVEVHHINSDPNDNSKKNLIWLCTRCHRAITIGLATLKRRRLFFKT